MYCTNCGKELPVDARFCTECGAKVEIEKAKVTEIIEANDEIDADINVAYKTDIETEETSDYWPGVQYRHLIRFQIRRFPCLQQA